MKIKIKDISKKKQKRKNEFAVYAMATMEI